MDITGQKAGEERRSMQEREGDPGQSQGTTTFPGPCIMDIPVEGQSPN